MNILRTERAAPPYFLLLLLLGFLAMFAASFHSFMYRPDTVKPGSPNAKANTQAADATPGAIAELPDGGPDLALTEQQADGLTSLMRKIQTNPNDADALMEIGETFLMAKDLARAEVFLGRAVLSKPSDIRPRHLLGVCLFQQKKIPEAARVFEELLEIDDADLMAQYNLALIYKYNQDKKSEANALFKRIAASPDADQDMAARAKKELQPE